METALQLIPLLMKFFVTWTKFGALKQIYSFSFSITFFSELVTNMDEKLMTENRFACCS